MYVPSINGEGIPVYLPAIEGEEPTRLGGDKNLVLVENPSNIDIYTPSLMENPINPLKYLCNGGTKYYSNKSSVGKFEYDLEEKDAVWRILNQYNPKENNCKLAEVYVNQKLIYVYVGSDGNPIYLTSSDNVGTHILRPKKQYYDTFFDSLDNFQKVLMNRDSKPLYTATFEVTEENSFGYVNKLKKFTFPLSSSEYNLAFGDAAFNSYVGDLQKYATVYDEIFCDNLWRSMTHESIKNFDWTYTREYGVGEEEEYVFGGTRMKKTIRLIGREFDEMKTYIDAIRNYKKVDYGKNNSMPDYFLTDEAHKDGWNITNIYPFDDNLKEITKLNGIVPYNGDYNGDGHGKYGYFYTCGSGKVLSNGEAEKYDADAEMTRHRISKYMSDKEYSLLEINNHFSKMLVLNSRSILRKKGTIQGIESLLSLFGLKSKRWFDKFNDQSKVKRTFDRGYGYDYDISEYVTIANCIEDEWNDSCSMNKIDYYNSTKTVAYDTIEYRNGIYVSYQGLPVRAYVKHTDENYYPLNNLPLDDNGKPIETDNKSKYLYPYFSNNKIIDGNPYYQMYGGWLNRKPKIFDSNNNVISNGSDTDDVCDDINLFKETYRNIRYVDKLKDLLTLPKTLLRNNDLCYVKDLTNQEYVIVDGVIYDIFEDEKGKYIPTYIRNNSCQVGSKLFASELTVSQSNGEMMKYVFDQYNENTEIRIYITNEQNGGYLKAVGKYYSINNVMFFKEFEFNGKKYGHFVSTYYEAVNEADVSGATNLFQLLNVDNKTEIGNGKGWEQLYNDSAIYKRVATVVDKNDGNNPHTGHMNYDGGSEYISYFTQLFKHALNGNQFNEKCYGDEFYEKIEEFKEIGFTLLESGENDDFCYGEFKDSKIHFFGKTFNENYENSGITVNDDNEYNGLIETNVSDHIMNLKRVNIDFYLKEDKDYQIKFYDEVIVPLLEQVLPSTLIINVNYCAKRQ